MEIGRFGVLRLTLFGVLTRRQATKCTMRTTVIVVAPPRFDQVLRMGDRFEAVHVETLVSETAVETFNKRVLHRLSRPDEVQLDAPTIGPFIKRLRGEFGAVIDRDRLRQ